MSKKSKKRKEAREREYNLKYGKPTSEKKEPIRVTKKGVIITSMVAIILILAILIPIIAVNAATREVNYMKDDLSRYISLNEKIYQGFELQLYFDSFCDDYVQRKINKLLFDNRTKEYNGANVLNLPITLGDDAYIYYRGYTETDGLKKEFDGSSNILGDVFPLGIGSSSFIPGFEEALIGKSPKDCSKFEIKKEGKTEKGDVIYLSYTAILPDGTAKTAVSERIDLSREDVDAVYGDGFKAHFENVEIGKKISEKLTFKVGDMTALYYDITPVAATRGEENPITIELRFPADYAEKSLRGVEAKFDVYITHTNVYSVPEYNDSFITEKLKLTSDSLKDFEGETLRDKHRNKLYKETEEEFEQTKKTLIEEAVFDYLKSSANIKKLPRTEVKDVYNEYVAEAELAYLSYSSSVSFDDFISYYYGLSSEENWRDYVQSRAEDVVLEKIVFYYVLREMKLIPSEADFDRMYQDTVQEYLNYYVEDIYDSELSKIENEDDRNKRILEIKEEMLDYYGKEYFEEIVYYDYSIDDIVGLATVKAKNE